MCPPLNQSLFPGEEMLNDWPILDYVTETRKGTGKEWGQQELWLTSLFDSHKWEKGEYQKEKAHSICVMIGIYLVLPSPFLSEFWLIFC